VAVDLAKLQEDLRPVAITRNRRPLRRCSSDAASSSSARGL